MGGLEVGRRRGGVGEAFAGEGVGEAEHFGVERLAFEGGEGGLELFGPGAEIVGSVDGVAEDGVAGEAHVDADLMGAAGLQHELEQRGATIPFDGVEVGDGVFAADAGDGHLAGVGEGAADGGDDAAVVLGELALDEGEVVAVEGVFAGLFGEGAVGAAGFGDDHDAGGVAVEAVDDAGPGGVVAGGFDGAAMVHDGVDEGAGIVARRGMDDEAGGFVDDEDVGVFEEDVEGDVFGRGGGFGRGRQGEADGVAGEYASAGALAGDAVDERAVLLDDFLDIGAGGVLYHLGQERIEAKAVVEVVDDGFEGIGGGVGRFEGHMAGKYSRERFVNTRGRIEMRDTGKMADGVPPGLGLAFETGFVRG